MHESGIPVQREAPRVNTMEACGTTLPKGLSIYRIAAEIEQVARNKLWVMNNMVALRAKYAGQFVACKNVKIIASAGSVGPFALIAAAFATLWEWALTAI